MTLATDIIAWARGRLGQTVDAGECWDLSNSALVASGAHGSEHFGTIGEDVDYIWGTAITLNAVRAGDVIQTRNHVTTTTVSIVTRYADNQEGSSETESTEERPHHTAIVTALLDRNGTLATLEQNVEPGGRVVQTKRLNTRNVPAVVTRVAGRAIDPRLTPPREVGVTIITTTTITVSGTIWAYRPVAR